MKAVQIKYSCHGCGIKMQTVTVPERDGTDTDSLKRWLDDVCMTAVSQHHARHSPLCSSPQCDLAIPLFDDAEGIGNAGTKPLPPEELEKLRESLKL